MKATIVQLTAIGMSQVKLLSSLNNQLFENGYDVHIVCSNDEYVSQIDKNKFNLHEVNIDRSINPKRNIKTIKELIKVFKKVKPDIVHVHTPVAAVLGRIAAKFSGVSNIVYTAHGFYFHDGMSKSQYKFYYLIEKYIGKFFTDYIFTQSKEDYDLAVAGKFLNNDNYHHISNGIDLEQKFSINNINTGEIAKIKAELKIQEDDIVFSFLGRMVREKGIIELLDAFSVINRELPNIKLLCIGSANQSERDNSVNEILKDFRRNQNIIFLGQVEKPEYYYFISDIFVLPSYREGMPRSIIEAMAMKNAVIATDIRGSREEINHQKNGYLVPVGSVTELVIHMRYLVNDPHKIADMKAQGYKKTLNEYNEKAVVSKQLGIFEKMLGVDLYEKNL